MSGRIPENIVERIKNETDIVAVISEFVSLKKSGKDFRGLCPFHQEKTPSFFVIPSKGFFHCFGCGKGGSAVNFIMEYERLDYPSALRFLAEKAGIDIPKTEYEASSDDGLYAALSLAASFYEKSLFDNPAGKETLKYLRSRGIDDETSRLFGLGFAPEGWDNLIKAASAAGVKTADLVAAGLVIKKEGYYDRFRKRLIIPIRSISGKTVGFGGRVLPGDDSPKYINSPETDVYKKGRILYGMDVSKNEIRNKNEAVVVEGYFDLISLFKAGIKNVVAVSGTGFTGEQSALLARFCRKVVLLFDSDSAGIKAAFRACGVLYNSGLEPGLVRLAKGFDPDTYVREKGADDLHEIISDSGDIIDFVRQGIKGRFSDQPISRQKRIVLALSELTAPIDDNLTRDLLARKMYEKLEIDINTLGMIKTTKKVSNNEGDRVPNVGMRKAEFDFIALLLAHPELLAEIPSTIDGTLFSEAEHAAIYSLLLKYHFEGRYPSIPEISEELNDDSANRRLREIAVQSEKMSGMKVEFPRYIDKLKSVYNKKRRAELKAQIEEAQKVSDYNKMEILTREFQNLKPEVKANDARV